MNLRRITNRSVSRGHESERGQVLVIVALSLVVLVAMVGIVIDGGFAWGKQRETQNASDAAAEAGAVVMAQRLAGVSPSKTDTDVATAVNAAFTDNQVGSSAPTTPMRLQAASSTRPEAFQGRPPRPRR